MTSVLFGGDNGAPALAATNFNTFICDFGTAWSATETARAAVVPEAFTLTNFYVELSTAPGAGTSWAFTVMKNGVATSLVANIANTATSATDTVNSATFAAGDTISIQSVPTGGVASPANQYWNAICNTSDQTAPVIGKNSTSVATGATNYLNAQFGNGRAPSVTETDYQILVPTSGTLSKLQVLASGTPGGTANYAVTLMKNGVASALTATVASAATTATDPSNSVSVVAGDSISIQIVPNGTPSARNFSYGMVFTPTTNGESFFGFGNINEPTGAAGTSYEQIVGTGANAWTATESSRLNVLGVTTIKAVYIKLLQAPGAGQSWTFTARQNTASSGVAATVSGTNTTGNGSGSALLAQGDKVAIQAVASATPATTLGVHGGVLLFIAPPATGGGLIPLRISNRNVGPMAMRHNFHQPIQLDTTQALVVITSTTPASTLPFLGAG